MQESVFAWEEKERQEQFLVYTKLLFQNIRVERTFNGLIRTNERYSNTELLLDARMYASSGSIDKFDIFDGYENFMRIMKQIQW